jgi:hypothetical protein
VRVATTILSLVLMVVVGVQSCAVYLGGSAMGEPTTAEGGALGLLVALLFLVGGAFAMPRPLVSFVAFLASRVFGLAGGATTSFGDLTIWGGAALVLAGLSFLGVREKRLQRVRSRSRVG